MGLDMEDICITCGKEVESELWGGKCEEGHVVVHQQKCSGCDAIMGQVTDDDYCGPELLYCPECVTKAKNI